jgi:hypothetical protein
LPTDAELDALEAFQLSLGRQQDLKLPLPLKGTVAKRGQEIFLDDSLGKCNLCHVNAGANAQIGGRNLGNANFNTGVEDLPDQPARLTRERVLPDDGHGTPGDGTFNVPPLVEAADTGPFFHNNAVSTLEAAVAFYDGEAFNNSPAGRLLASLDPKGKGIELDGTQIAAIASFLRVLNALENIRASIELLETACVRRDRADGDSTLQQAISETSDSIRVLTEGGLHAGAVPHLERSLRLSRAAMHSWFRRSDSLRKAIAAQRDARAELVQ